MTMGTVVACPHCRAENPGGAAFCESCGKALPTRSAAPRVISGDSMPTTAAGAKLVGGELQKATKSAGTALLIVSIIQLVVGAIFVAIIVNAPAANRAAVNLSLLIASTVGLGLVFLGLFFWSRRSPLPATITGLVIYSTLIAINVVVSIASFSQNSAGRGGFGGLGIGWLDIVIIVVLSRGIGAALKSRRLMDTAVQ
jgi:hypothetical protein